MDPKLKLCRNCAYYDLPTTAVPCGGCYATQAKAQWIPSPETALVMFDALNAQPKASATVVPPKKTSDGGSTGYYKIPEGATDLQDLIELKDMNFSVGNIFKACYRLGEKSGTAADYDLRKIIFFAEREIARRAK